MSNFTDKSEKRKEALRAYGFYNELQKCFPFGNGHINDTFCLELTDKKYILQRINHDIFTEPEKVMANIEGVTNFLRKKGVLTLNVIKTLDGKNLFKDSIGSYWRVYDFILGARTYDIIEDENLMLEAGVAFGNFQKQLTDYPAETLYETIPDFHNTPLRLKTLKKAIESDVESRAGFIKEEIDFILSRECIASFMTDLLEQKSLPLRVTLNDTKINNVMIDDSTGKGICVIDLDTVMPGLVANDFGEAVRIGCSTSAEDEIDLSKIKFNIDYYKAFSRGFMSISRENLSELEIETLPMGAKLMTYENAVRFLTDYLLGDVYFKIHRENHNLERCKAQLQLFKEMENIYDELVRIVKTY